MFRARALSLLLRVCCSALAPPRGNDESVQRGNEACNQLQLHLAPLRYTILKRIPRMHAYGHSDMVCTPSCCMARLQVARKLQDSSSFLIERTRHYSGRRLLRRSKTTRLLCSSSSMNRFSERAKQRQRIGRAGPTQRSVLASATNRLVPRCTPVHPSAS